MSTLMFIIIINKGILIVHSMCIRGHNLIIFMKNKWDLIYTFVYLYSIFSLIDKVACNSKYNNLEIQGNFRPEVIGERMFEILNKINNSLIKLKYFVCNVPFSEPLKDIFIKIGS